MNDDHWRRRHVALLDTLTASGALHPSWRPSFDAVPRHRFIPSDIWRQEATCVPVTNDAAWWDLVYSDQPVVTQVDDGVAGGPGIATSSNSMPSIVAKMLRELDVRDGQRVLEIGTGSGWNAALLAERLGGTGVTTVEVDPLLARRATEAIMGAGYHPEVVWGDGERGWEAGAPYDRVIGTCSVRRVPPAWVAQCAPGGVIVVPLAQDFWSGALLRLIVADGAATGRFVGGATFMSMRSHRPRADAPVDSGTGRRSVPTTDPRNLADLGFARYATGRLPGVVMADGDHEGTYQVWLHDRRGSAATATGGEVWQYGPRDLWEEVTTVYEDFTREGSPSADAFGVTVTPQGDQRIWLREPDNVVA
ncbi:protein-L-isoaspartate O-methyltransferase [Streptomyces buecherae]|uniref:protein-L-isoaspartate O-methyltransferase n=1 Tax=Streptomyces buecherae TaxID=2763006 RepID=UPI0036C5BAF5